MSTDIALIVLAAGKGSRMKSDLPKVLHQIAGAPLMVHALRSGAALEPARQILIAGHGADQVEAAAKDYDPELEIALQSEQKGTGHAVAQAREALAGFEGDVIVLYGDTPFIRPETLEAMVAARTKHDVIVLGFEAADPGKYGRLITDGDALEKIVEWKDASAAERAVTLCNSGVMCASATLLFEMIDQLSDDNAAGEYYLTDVPGLARAAGRSAGVVVCDEAETLGINTPLELMAAGQLFQDTMRARALSDGVKMQAPDTVIFAYDTVLGRGAEIEPYVVFAPGVSVENDAHIRAFSHLEDAHVARGAVIGPYARLRPGTEIHEDAKVGNFVEIKKANIAAGAKVNHLSYVGDAEVGEAANIGAGTVTCNYDGVLKHRTVIEAGAFIGSGSMLVAPVRIGADALTASGSVITEDVPAEALALGRARQVNKPGLAARLKAHLLALKAKQKG
ncbi:bifunctional UDP-N-acetylglucosamine diphosphorylase/glucosamine-1-phosphate N-acetyltransferase GlmU [Shimia ponticola]|uniref:bifunctional UDP-N-acetylglucosamine diphosphorylase/glucosamine-1-phosphate N-acetyltransferase GlmU n=1 Tax=Shimia ponticola TaxID=2582893 RepID=UPI0011BEF8D3|nr:bifunctional UDP-N-acetylglucosamine diphosphorylase/glucosamine-1-phosphate N-acetyltransferase GlmU [Shimia ponticola]